ncbi:PGF-pre-PGF domain-containing protein [Candidatus Woesearchaeota archaeon]|nr:PGF-pre-PGF domain-containing protein [Candidatus Woesearchaeota archaeon]
MNKRRYSELMFLVVVVGILAIMAMGAVYVSVDQPTADTNYSGSMVINATIDNDTSQDNNATNATFSFYNATDGTLVYNVTILPEDSNTNSTFNSTIATATFLPDGTYNLTVNMTNSSSQSNSTWENATIATIQIDNTAPLVTINSPGNNTFVGNTSAAIVFNVTIIESGVGLDTVNLTNGSRDLGTETQIGNDWNLSVFNTSLTEGSNTLSVTANDTLNNLNNSESIVVWFDQSVPTVTLVSPLTTTWVGTLGQYTFNFSDGLSPNASCELFIDETGYGVNAAVLNDTDTVITPNASITTGVHNWDVNCTDLGANVGTSTNIESYDVLDVNVTAPTNASYTSSTDPGNVSFQFNYLSQLINSTAVANVSCELFVTNSSGDYLAMGVNETALNNTVMTITNNQSLLSDLTPNGASANWTANCTYNGTTIDVDTGFYTLFVDNVTPSTPVLTSNSITSSSITLDIATSTDVTSCTDTDADTSISSVSAGNWKLVIGGLGSGSSKAFQVTCTDSAGNGATSVSTSFTTTSSSGGGSGGSSGGISTGVTGTSGKRVWTSLKSGETAKVPIKNGAIGVTNVEFDISETVYGAWLSVTKVDSFPSSVKGFEKNIYRKIDVSKSSTLKDSLITSGKMDFKVEKAWLTDKGLSKENIALFRYNNDVWNQLNTVIGTDDGQYIHFSAKTPGFSYFIIGERVTGNVPETDGQAAGTEPAVEKPVPEATAEPVTEAPVRSQPVWPWAVLVLILIVAGVWYWMSKKK